MLVKDSKGRRLEVSVGGKYDDDIQITECDYIDHYDLEVSDNELDYIYKTYSSELYDAWIQHCVSLTDF